MHATARIWKSEDNLWVSVFPPYHVGPGGGMQPSGMAVNTFTGHWEKDHQVKVWPLPQVGSSDGGRGAGCDISLCRCQDHETEVTFLLDKHKEVYGDHGFPVCLSEDWVSRVISSHLTPRRRMCLGPFTDRSTPLGVVRFGCASQLSLTKEAEGWLWGLLSIYENFESESHVAQSGLKHHMSTRKTWDFWRLISQVLSLQECVTTASLHSSGA